MATESIFTNVKITDPEAVERFVAALEESEKQEKDMLPPPPYHVMDDLDEIRKFVARRNIPK